MNITVNGISCEYELYRTDSPDTVLFLHGWGGDLRSFAGVYKAMCGLNMTCLNLAFPPIVPPDWGIYEYAAYVKDVTAALKIENPVTVGHSFGGRVGIILAAQGACKKLVLVDSAGMKPRLSIKKKMRIAAYRRAVKHGKSLDGFGSADYNNVDMSMRGVFVRVVNTHLESLLPYIRCKTMLFWGRNDKDTPLYMAKRLRRGIADSKLVVVCGGHYAYIDAHYAFIQSLKNFILE